MLSLTGMMFLVLACNKQDAKAPEEDQQIQPTAISKRSCGTYEVLQAQLAEDPGLRARMEQIEAYTQNALRNPGKYRILNDTIKIPVVVHVIYKTAAQNISNARVQSQIDVLNEDFQSISFQNVVSPGLKVLFVRSEIRHIPTKTSSWSTNDAVKSTLRGGDDPIDPSHYLNLWVCNLGKGLLGYAQFPGGNAATDGVVILYSAFGSINKVQDSTYTTKYNLGRTATHEVGHWMNLRHIWGDDNGACTGSDYVDDTPNQGAENYGSPAYPHVSCNNAVKGKGGDMFMNYMDYTDDAAMYMFSLKQSTRMMLIFSADGSRAAFAQN